MHFTHSHEWIRVAEGIGTVGVSQYAQSELGEIVYVELPKMDQEIHLGKEVAVLESTKAAADIYAPVSGRVIAINEDLKKTPNLINESPEELGWLFKVRLSHPEELAHLLSLEDYKKLITSV